MSGVTWQYRAATAAGEVVEGRLVADTERDAMEELRRRALVPVAVSGTATGAGRSQRRASRGDAVTTAIRTLATMVGGGATIDRALEFAGRHAAHPEVATALAGVRGDVLGGQPLAQALRARVAVFGSLAPAMVRAGEESGALDASLARLADHMDATRELRDRLQGALLYPALLGVVAGLGVLVLLGFVVPRFVDLLDTAGTTLPLSTRVLVGASAVLRRAGIPLLAIAGAAVVGGRWWLQDPSVRRRWHAARLRLPLAGALEWETWTARFARTFAMLLDGGTAVLPSLRIAREGVLNGALGEAMDGAVARVERGERLATAFEGVLPPLAVQLLAVGEESATLGDAARRVADTFESGVQRALRQAIGLLEPALIVVFGGMVGFIALAMLQAIYSINATLP